MDIPAGKRYSTTWGGRELVLETGKYAKLVSGSVTVRYGDTLVLVTAQMSDSAGTADFCRSLSNTKSGTTPSARFQAHL